MENYPNLFKPIRFRGMEVRNRIFVPPMHTNHASATSEITDEMVHYYGNMAKGGAGLITIEACDIDGLRRYMPQMFGLFDDKHAAGLARITEAVHKHGAKVSAQLIQAGAFANSAVSGTMPLAASPIPHIWNRGDKPIEMTHEDIKEYTKKYVDAALRAKKYGCDSVEIHSAHGHALLGGFLSPISNKRTDEYGGDLMSRARFLLEVAEAVRNAVGEDFPISIRLSADELEEGSNHYVDYACVIRALAEKGVDYVHLSNGSLFNSGTLLPPTGSPKALNMEYVEAIKKMVPIPVGSVGRIKEPWVAEMLLETGKMDFVYMGRSMICDGELPNKIKENRLDDIRPCIGCLTCFQTSMMGKPARCSMNPAVGEYVLDDIKPTETKKKILVVGGGPAGLEAARVAAQRGHQVKLIEAADKLGGQFIIAAYPPTKQELTSGLKYLIRELYKAGVEVELNKIVTSEVVREENPDCVILASGGSPILPKWLKDSDHPNIMTAWDALNNVKPIGQNILVIGGGSVGCETADFLAEAHNFRALGGRKVSIVEMQSNIVMEDQTPNRDYLVTRLNQKPVTVYTEAKVESISAEEVVCQGPNGDITLRGIDTIVCAMGTASNSALADELKDLDTELITIGDAVKIGKIFDAVCSGRRAALTV